VNDRKHLIVGLFVLAGLVLLGAMVIWFEGVAGLVRGGYDVYGHLPNSAGIRAGKRVHLDGIEVGSVVNVATSQPQEPGIWVQMQVRFGTEIPAEYQLVAQQSAMGEPFLDFQAKPTACFPTEGLSDGGNVVRGELPEDLGLTPGQRVRVDGADAGSVLEVVPPPSPAGPVSVLMRLRPNARIPCNSRPVVVQDGEGRPVLDWRKADKPLVYLTTDGAARVYGQIKSPSLLPDDVLQDIREGLATLKGFKSLLPKFEAVIEQRTVEEVEAGHKLPNLWTAMARFQSATKTVEDQIKQPHSPFNKLLTTWTDSGAELKAGLKEAREGVAEARKTFDAANESLKTYQALGEKAAKSLEGVDTLVTRFAKSTDKLDAAVANFDGLVGDVRAGKGTVGKLVTDDELYRALLDLAENLQTFVDDARRLFIMWRQEGILSKEGK